MGLKVRANAWPLAQMIIDAGGSLEALPPDADGWHSAESLTRGMVTQLWPTQHVAAARPWGEEHPVDWARRTGRVTAQSEPRWRADYARDQAGIGQVLASLDPVLATEPATGAATTPRLAALAGTPGSAQARYQAAVAAAIASVPPPSTTPLLDDLDRDLFGPSDAEKRAAEDAAAERELAEHLQREAEEAAGAPSDADVAPLFGPGTTGTADEAGTR
jgi:hypothetical protein